MPAVVRSVRRLLEAKAQTPPNAEKEDWLIRRLRGRMKRLASSHHIMSTSIQFIGVRFGSLKRK